MLCPNYTQVATVEGKNITAALAGSCDAPVVSTGSPGSGTEVIAFECCARPASIPTRTSAEQGPPASTRRFDAL